MRREVGGSTPGRGSLICFCSAQCDPELECVAGKWRDGAEEVHPSKAVCSGCNGVPFPTAFCRHCEVTGATIGRKPQD